MFEVGKKIHYFCDFKQVRAQEYSGCQDDSPWSHNGVTGRKREGRDKEINLRFSNFHGNGSYSFKFLNSESSDGCVKMTKIIWKALN